MKTTLQELLSTLDEYAPFSLQEGYDNSGLLCGNPSMEITGVITSVDITPAVVQEAVTQGANVIVAHHPLIFKGLRRLDSGHWLSEALIAAVKNDIALVAMHTNLDHVHNGVNSVLAQKLNLHPTRVLAPIPNRLLKIVVFCPINFTEQVIESAFDAGAGHIQAYSDCSFRSTGTGTFKATEGANPFIGKPGARHSETEERVELILPDWKLKRVKEAIIKSHPYEEVALDVFRLDGATASSGAGMIGSLKEPVPVEIFLNTLKSVLKIPFLRHTALCRSEVKTIAWCGGSGYFLLDKARSEGADIFITGDIKYHEFFEANGKLVLVDAGHFETEQFTPQLLADFISGNFTTFATRPTEVNTNPILYY